MARRKNDFYPTPEWATEVLVVSLPSLSNATIYECCAGDGAIANYLQQTTPYCHGNDIDITFDWESNFDVTDPALWNIRPRYDWVVTNPPFNQAGIIVPLAYNHAAVGIAMLLRLSFLEPVEDRGAWLNEHPPTSLIVLPRISFTGDGKTDSVTCAWMIWERGRHGTIRVAENPRFVPANGGIKPEPQEGLFAALKESSSDDSILDEGHIC
jgi:hypothetical protein